MTLSRRLKSLALVVSLTGILLSECGNSAPNNPPTSNPTSDKAADKKREEDNALLQTKYKNGLVGDATPTPAKKVASDLGELLPEVLDSEILQDLKVRGYDNRDEFRRVIFGWENITLREVGEKREGKPRMVFLCGLTEAGSVAYEGYKYTLVSDSGRRYNPQRIDMTFGDIIGREKIEAVYFKEEEYGKEPAKFILISTNPDRLTKKETTITLYGSGKYEKIEEKEIEK